MKNFKSVSVVGLLVCLFSLSALADDSANSKPTKHHRTGPSSSAFDSHEELSSMYRHESSDWIGFNTGVGVSSANWSVPAGTTPSTSTRTRPLFGVNYEHRFTQYFTFRPELDYVQRGFTATGQNGSADFAENFLELPLLLKATLPVDAWTPYVAVGPYVGLCTGSGAVTKDNAGNSTPSSIDNQINSFEFGFTFAVGTSYALSKTAQVELVGRYSLGLTNQGSALPANTSVTLDNIQVLAGLGLAL